MRTALIVSAALHVLLLGALLINLPRPEPFATAEVDALPVELVTIDDETDLTIGEPDETEVVEEAAPETVEAPEPPAPETSPGANDAEAETIATEEDARPSTEEATAPEPAAPEPPAEASEPAESTPVETAAPVPEALEPAPEAVSEAPSLPANVLPRARPTPPPRRPTEVAEAEPAPPRDTFDADRVSQLINRVDAAGGGSGAAQASLGSASGRTAAALTLSEADALRAQMQRCWNPPIGLAASSELVTVVRIRLGEDGSVLDIRRVEPAVVAGLTQAAADAAERAVIQCQPYRLPPQKYDAWKEVQVTFDPRELF